MSIATRKFSASPKRSAAETWGAIVTAITSNNETLRDILNSVTGVAASVIAERTTLSYPITIVGSGPRLRIYCLYDDDATIAEEGHEDSLSWDIFKADWKVYFPAEEADLKWISAVLRGKGDQFAVYKTGEMIKGEEEPSSPTSQLTINAERFKKNV